MSKTPGPAALAVSLSGILLLLGASRASAESYMLPSSSFRAGANGAEYRTDVRIINPASAAATVTAYFYDQVTSTTWQANSFQIEARSQAAFDNILRSLFGKTLDQGAYGPIRFEANGPLLVNASVNNVNACSSGAVSGQWLPGVLTSQSLKSGVIGQLAISSNSASGYRSNLVFVNGGNSAATATVRIRRGGGDLLSTATIGPLSPNGFRQVALDATTFPGVGGTTDTNLWLEFASDQPVIAYATVIHNVSGDPFAVMASADAPSSAMQEVTFTLPGGVPLIMVRIPAGSFQMGAPATEQYSWDNHERPVHQVSLTSDFYIGRYEVTQAQWQAVMGTLPSYNSTCGASCPVEQVSWDDIRGATGFIAKLNQLLGTSAFRLPTEAEWERATRGGTQTRYSFGDALTADKECGKSPELEQYAWSCANATGTHPVGMKMANPFGLFDVHGNVQEWVEDCYGTYPSTAQTNPTGPTCSSEPQRVFRGGSYGHWNSAVRSAWRDYHFPNMVSRSVGFRLAMSLSR